MKKTILALFILFNVIPAFGQSYIVTYLKGDVLHAGKPLKLHDRLDGATQISSSDKTAEIALFSALKGKFRLTFANSKPIQTNQGARHSELYQLVVADYLQGYNSQKALTTRRSFSLEDFFNYADRKHLQNKVFVAEDERLPVTGYIDRFFICKINGPDTVCSPVDIIKDSLVFNRGLIKNMGSDEQNPGPLKCFIKHGYTNEGKYTEAYFSQPVQLTLLTTAYLKELVKSFAEGLNTYYQGDKSKMTDDVEAQLAYYYGTYDEAGVRKVLAGLVK